ncbi:unnamed protein product [Mytilus edulis]|uniref:WSC domain-containing protein n=1 Tax=Mytilus edulis TaxID=6550 RepID=A0A8S3RSD3_MYTED|nr:unnamed protein product [Mytilus edulis]
MDRHDRTLPYGGADYHGQLTNDLCLSHCCSFLDDATFMGTEAGFQCYCSNVNNTDAFVLPRFDDACDSPCDGNSSEICGGGWRLRCSDSTEAISPLTANEIYTVTQYVYPNTEMTTYPENKDSTPSWTPEIATRLSIGTDSITTNIESTEKPVKTSTSTFSTISPTTGDIITTIYPPKTKTIFTVTPYVQQDAELTTYKENADSTPSVTPEITARSDIGTDSLTTNNKSTEKPVMTFTSTFSTFSPITGNIISEVEGNVSYCSCTNCVSKNQTFKTESELEKRLVNLRNLISINKKDTNLYKRTKQSANDPRKSSRYLGVGGVIVMSLPVMFIVSIDILKILNVA